MHINLNNALSETDITAEVTFQDRDQANEFAKAYTRHTLMGHAITKSTVKIYNVTDETKAWIDQYISQMGEYNAR